MTFDRWLTYFRDNPARHEAIEARIDWDSAATVSQRSRRAFIRSF
ncbi:hypothetical protein [Phytoactinopolyspora halophila]|nr:hypothetical protein [Phytoactinopolyspora halophila]